jgi:ketosteroid isomerase-like protein
VSSSVSVLGQTARDQIMAADRGFAKATAEIGLKSASLQFTSDDAIIFRPEAINAKDFWTRRNDHKTLAVRTMAVADVASSGQIGFTTGSIEYFPNGLDQPAGDYGQYVTIWGRRDNGGWRAVLELFVKHEKDIQLPIKQIVNPRFSFETNKAMRSAADPSMRFLRASMSQHLGDAYRNYAADEIRFLRDGFPPITGRKQVIEATKDYRAVKFPFKVALMESGDMAYSWNPCEYNVSDEGMERGNCLHVWKLRDKKWLIVLAAFARVESDLKPVLKTKTARQK